MKINERDEGFPEPSPKPGDCIRIIEENGSWEEIIVISRGKEVIEPDETGWSKKRERYFLKLANCTELSYFNGWTYQVGSPLVEIEVVVGS